MRLALSPPRPGGRSVGYFYTIDLLRGLAAAAILFWHYVHFYMIGSTVVGYDPATNPMYRQVWFLYLYGGNAVQLFWLISGFTFAAVYSARQVGTRTFVLHRFSRLYPLHLLTLCVVAALQLASFNILGHASIYDNNDLPHFIDQLLFTDGWGPYIRFSFNGPTWTVSVEILIYALFWLILPWLFRLGLVFPTVLAVVSFGLSRLGPAEFIFQGGVFVFSGCALYPVFLACRGWWPAIAAVVGLPFAAGLLVLLRWHAIGITSTLFLVSLVLAGSFVELGAGRPRARRLCKWVGNNTYGVYLWHVPVQISILIAVGWWGVPRSLFLSPVFLVAYLSTVVAIARLSFLFVEHPARLRLNDRYARRDAA